MLVCIWLAHLPTFCSRTTSATNQALYLDRMWQYGALARLISRIKFCPFGPFMERLRPTDKKGFERSLRRITFYAFSTIKSCIYAAKTSKHVLAQPVVSDSARHEIPLGTFFVVSFFPC